MKNYNCPTCGKIIPVDRLAIKAGDEVTFCKVTNNARSTRFSSKEGVVSDRTGDVVIVTHKKQSIPMHISDVTPSDAPSPLTYAFCGTCECAKEAA